MRPVRARSNAGSRSTTAKRIKRARVSKEDSNMTTFQPSSSFKNFLAVPSAPSRKLSQRIAGKASEVEEFLSSDVERELEMSFASTMSIHSPPRDNISLAEDDSQGCVPMDISPAPPRIQPEEHNPLADWKRPSRGRAYTVSTRLFGKDVSNESGQRSLKLPSPPTSTSGTSTSSGNKKLQRSALPFEWMSSSQSENQRRNLFDQPQHVPSSPASDAMDVDTSFSQSVPTSSQFESGPLSAAPTITAFDLGDSKHLSSGPLSAAPTITSFNQLFYDTTSPAREREDSNPLNISVDESPMQPFTKKRRSASPERVLRDESFAEAEQSSLRRQASFSSSPAHLSSPSAHKLERIVSGPLALKKPMLAGLGAPLALNMNNKRPRRPVMSAVVPPGDLLTDDDDEAPVVDGKENKEGPSTRHLLPPVRRAFSAMLPASLLEQSFSSEDGSSFSHDSPAQAYAKRQQFKTIRRCDGTDDLRPWTGASALVSRDQDMKQRGLRRSEERQERSPAIDRDTPRSKYLSANSSNLGGFGDNEAFGKALPCHRVKEDGLMRINCKTMAQLLDGVYNSRIASFTVIDCRFDYEYNGGHIPGAINLNTTSGVEDLLLGKQVTKPKPSTSGDAGAKDVLIFHCEFSHKRAPTFAKHLRSKDRSMNNHNYPRIHYPEVYILEGGYCQYFKECAPRCEPNGYVPMDDPHHAQSRREDLDQFRKAKFGRTKSYAYGEGKSGLAAALGPKRNTAPSGGATHMFAAANAARTRRTNGMLQTLEEDSSGARHEETDEETDIGDSPCPPPTKAVAFKGKRLGRAPLARAETYGPSRMNLGY